MHVLLSCWCNNLPANVLESYPLACKMQHEILMKLFYNFDASEVSGGNKCWIPLMLYWSKTTGKKHCHCSETFNPSRLDSRKHIFSHDAYLLVLLQCSVILHLVYNCFQYVMKRKDKLKQIIEICDPLKILDCFIVIVGSHLFH